MHTEHLNCLWGSLPPQEHWCIRAQAAAEVQASGLGVALTCELPRQDSLWLMTPNSSDLPLASLLLGVGNQNFLAAEMVLAAVRRGNSSSWDSQWCEEVVGTGLPAYWISARKTEIMMYYYKLLSVICKLTCFFKNLSSWQLCPELWFTNTWNNHM